MFSLKSSYLATYGCSKAESIVHCMQSIHVYNRVQMKSYGSFGCWTMVLLNPNDYNIIYILLSLLLLLFLGFLFLRFDRQKKKV